jgi:hypothetical protein
MNQRVGGDFFQARLQVSPPQKMVSTVTYTSRQCPVCGRYARTLVRPPHHVLQSDICVDFCEGDSKYPGSYVSFQGSWLKDGFSVVEALRGADGHTPTREELVSLFKDVLRELGFWRLLLGRIK